MRADEDWPGQIVPDDQFQSAHLLSVGVLGRPDPEQLCDWDMSATLRYRCSTTLVTSTRKKSDKKIAVSYPHEAKVWHRWCNQHSFSFVCCYKKFWRNLYRGATAVIWDVCLFYCMRQMSTYFIKWFIIRITLFTSYYLRKDITHETPATNCIFALP